MQPPEVVGLGEWRRGLCEHEHIVGGGSDSVDKLSDHFDDRRGVGGRRFAPAVDAYRGVRLPQISLGAVVVGGHPYLGGGVRCRDRVHNPCHERLSAKKFHILVGHTLAPFSYGYEVDEPSHWGGVYMEMSGLEVDISGQRVAVAAQP